MSRRIIAVALTTVVASFGVGTSAFAVTAAVSPDAAHAMPYER